MKTLHRIIVTTLAAVIVSACATTEPEDKALPEPVITFPDAPEDVYEVKKGERIWLEPVVENSAGCTYRWIADGQTVGTDIIYLFDATETGKYYLTFEASNDMHTVDKEIRVDVLDDMPPVISLAVPEGGFIVAKGAEKLFEPVVKNDLNASFAWSVNGKTEARTKEYTFSSDETGEFALVFTAENEDGSDSIEFGISVRNAEDMPFVWEWERDTYNMKAGRTITLAPVSVSNSFDAVYTWRDADEVLQQSDTPQYVFTPEHTGTYSLSVSAENTYMTLTKQLTINVFDNEEAFMREITDDSSPDVTKVWEFLPAPGQFINEYYTAENMTEACAYAEERFAMEAYVSLGAFGGYIVAGFDHSVINDGDYNLQILGNSFDGSSEPGIVWVMQDENGDGIPNDTWYELKGSEYGKPETLSNYAVTYYKPAGPQQDVPWTDNLGNEGTVDYLGAFHKQDYYYPAWIGTDSYTLRGTRLEDRTTDQSGNGTYWYNGSFDWGYADNFSPTDRLTDDDKYDAGINANHLRISDAVDCNGNPADLKYIDFVKIQTGVQAKAGWLGENSTEVFGIRDFNMVKSGQK